ncbi:MAG: rhodanese-like domain-containing protein [Candidatus Kapaibacterium sp.]
MTGPTMKPSGNTAEESLNSGTTGTNASDSRERFGEALSGRVLREALAIILVSALIAAIVNTWYHPSPLPYIYESRKVEAADDSLFDSLVNKTSPASGGPTIAAEARSAPASPLASSQKTETSSSSSAPTTAAKAAASSETDKTSSDPGKPTPPPAQEGSLKLPVAVSYEQVVKLLARPGSATFIDARKGEEHEKGAFPGSLNVDVLQFQANPMYRDECMRLLYSLPKDKIVVAYCGGGTCELSHELCDIMIPMGFTKVFIYLGGWNEYKEKQGLK